MRFQDILTVASQQGGGAAAVSIGPDANVSTAWAGNLGSTTLTASHTLDADSSGTRLVASTVIGMTSPIYSSRADTNLKTVQHTLTGLAPDTAYYFGIEVNGVIKTTKQGHFVTMPTGNSYRFAFGGCQSGANNGKVLGQIEALATPPRFFVHLGDLHYDDISTDSEALFDASYDSVLAGTYSGPFLRHIPTVSIHDDHDYGPNDSGGDSPSRPSSLAAFRRRRPNPAGAFSGALDPVCFSFVQGRIRFVVTDMRSQRDSTTHLGSAQKAWFKAQIDAAYAANQMVCWVHSTPFISNGWSDGWDGGTRQAERQELATYIVNAGMGSRIFCLTGDYHMMAADSGASSDYSDYGGLRMPVFHACGLSAAIVASNIPMDLGYSFPKTSIAGYIDVTDDGTTMTLDFTGIGMDAADASATTILMHTATLPRPALTAPTSITLVQETYRRLSTTDGVGAGPTVYTTNPYRTTPVAGNLLLFVVNLKGANTGTLAAPSGFTRLGSDQLGDNTFHQAVFYRIADGSETSIALTTSGPRIHASALLEFHGVHTVTPFGQDVVDAASATTRTTVAPAFTPATANEVALVFALTQSNGAFSSGVTWATGYIQRFYNQAATTAGALGFIVASKQLATASVAETATATWSGTAGKTQARAITLLPADVTAPTITSSASPSVAENSALTHTLTANETVTWTKTGGADAALFSLAGNSLTMTAKDYEAPADANADNVYVVQVTATDASGNATSQTINVTVTDVADTGTTRALEDGSARNLESGASRYLE